MSDTAAFLQMDYDQAVHRFGEFSPEAIAAEQSAHQFFKGLPAPVTLAVFRTFTQQKAQKPLCLSPA